MLDFLLWNKIARIIVQLADTLHISTDRALQIFYDSDVCRMPYASRQRPRAASDERHVYC